MTYKEKIESLVNLNEKLKKNTDLYKENAEEIICIMDSIINNESKEEIIINISALESKLLQDVEKEKENSELQKFTRYIREFSGVNVSENGLNREISRGFKEAVMIGNPKCNNIANLQNQSLEIKGYNKEEKYYVLEVVNNGIANEIYLEPEMEDAELLVNMQKNIALDKISTKYIGLLEKNFSQVMLEDSIKAVNEINLPIVSGMLLKDLIRGREEYIKNNNIIKEMELELKELEQEKVDITR